MASAGTSSAVRSSDMTLHPGATA